MTESIIATLNRGRSSVLSVGGMGETSNLADVNRSAIQMRYKSL